MAEPNLQEIHDYLIALASKAGEMITSAHPSVSNTDTKKNSSDLVTETDQAVEHMVSTALKSAYPTYDFLGEETSPSGPSPLTPAPTFIVDPIDGTTNFVHTHPYISISLAFVHHLTPLIGIVYNPFTHTLYSAISHHGAYLTTDFNRGPLARRTRLPLRQPPPALTGLSEALVAVEWGSERAGNNWRVKTRTFEALAGGKEEGGAMVHSLRSLGSAALNLCAVASGGLDVYWEGGCWAWDVAAGWVVVKEAGGLVVGGNKGEWEPRVDGRRYLAVRGGEGGEALVREFWGFVRGRLEYEV